MTYQGNVDIDLLHADAMFQDANSNLFQNITIKQHIAMLYDAKINTITSRTISRGKTMMTRLGLEQPEQLYNTIRSNLAVWLNAYLYCH